MRLNDFRETIYLTAGTFISRITGFVREIAVAHFFGAGQMTDSFLLAFSIPTLLRNVLGEDMFERTVMPIFKNLWRKNPASAFLYWRRVFGWVIIGAIVSILLLILLLKPLLHLMAPGFSSAGLALAHTLSLWLMPEIFFITLATYMGATLLFEKKYFTYSFAPAMMNVGTVLALFLLARHLGIVSLTLAYVFGALLFALIQVPLTLRCLRDYQSQIPLGSHSDPESTREANRSTLNNGSQVFLMSLVNKSVELVDKAVATLVTEGAVTWLYFSFRIVHLPVAIFSLSISRITATELSNMKNKHDADSARKFITRAISHNFFLMMPITVFTIVFSYPIIQFIYQRGNFDAVATEATAYAFQYYMLSVLPMGLSSVFARVFSVLEKNRYPFYASIIGALLNISLDLILYRTSLAHAGIALATAISFLAQLIVLLFWCHRFFCPIPLLFMSVSMARTFLASIPAFFLFLAVKTWFATSSVYWILPLCGALFIGLYWGCYRLTAFIIPRHIDF